MLEGARFGARANTAFILFTFSFVYYGLPKIVEQCFGQAQPWLESVLNWGPLVLAPLIVAWGLLGREKLGQALGLSAPWILGVGVGLSCVLPFALLCAGWAEWAPGPTPGWDALHTALIPGFTEELFFRAMLFGLLFRIAGWGYVPASAVACITFGCAHAHQGASLEQVLGIVGVTGFGSIWFSWLYAEWEWNLWIPVSLHTLMNLLWGLFEMGGNALGAASGNLGRALVILTSVILTVWRIRQRRHSVLAGRWWLSEAAARKAN